MRIRTHLLLLIGCVLIPGLIGAGVAIQKVRNDARAAALRGLEESVRATVLLVDGQIQRSIGALIALGNSSDLASGNLQALYRQAATLDLPPDVWTLLLDETGTQRFNTAVPFGTPPPPPIARARVEQVFRTGQPLITDAFIGPVTGKLVTTVYVPAGADMARRYAVAQVFSVEHWKKEALRPQGHADWVVAVIGRDGKFISRSLRADVLVGEPARPELVAAAAAAPSGIIRHKTLEEVDVYDAFAHSALTGWTIAVAAPVQSIEASATEAAAPLALGLLVALIAGATSLTLLGRALHSDITRAMTTADALGRGAVPAALTSSGLTELGALHASLREAGRLLAAERSARVAVEVERTRLLAGEKQAREGAQRQNAAKDQFLAMLGHELRNPLAAISGATEVLARRSVEVRNQHFLEIARRQCRHLARIVDDLLDTSRMLTGKLALESAPLNLGAATRSCVDALRATQSGSEIELSAPADQELWINGDRVRIEQVLSNLVVNAIKFSPPGSAVRVALSGEGGDALLRVVDLGQGIAPDLLGQIFEPFVQGPCAPGKTLSGLGIGLALVKRLVELHGGAIEVAPNAHGPGTTFTVKLPLVSAPARATPQRPDRGSAGKVLLVEDNADARYTTAAVLRMIGYEVSEAEDGAAALRAIDASAFDAVVMDLGLPDRSGHEIAREIRLRTPLARLALIALSGYGQETDKAMALGSGFDAHLAKPVSLEDLAREIERQRERRAQ